MTNSNIETMHSRDARLINDTVAEVEQQIIERMFNVLIASRTKASWHAKLVAPTKSNLLRFLDMVITDTLEALDAGLVLSFRSPKQQPNPPVLIAQLLHEAHKGDRDALRADLLHRFKIYLGNDDTKYNSITAKGHC
jgi:hypothetical protein